MVGVNREVLSMGGLGVGFRACTNSMGTVHSIDFRLSGNRALTVINRSNSNGSIAAGDLVKLLTGGTRIINNSVVCHNRSLLGGARGRVRRVHNGSVTVVFRSPVASLSPAVGVNHRVTRPLVVRGGISGGGT